MTAPLTIDTIFPYLNDRDARPYERLSQVSRDPIPAVEVTEEVYDHFLNVLPPGDYPGGFFVIEAVTGGIKGGIYSAFTRRGGRFFHQYLDLEV